MNSTGSKLAHFAFEGERVANTGIKRLIEAAAHLGDRATAARSMGDESEAEASLREALALASEAAAAAADDGQQEILLDILRLKMRLALRCGETGLARGWLRDAIAIGPSIAQAAEWQQFFDMAAWTDEWLIAAVRRDPPDAASLDELAVRYWKEVFGRCYLLTLNYDKASDLAQQAWSRVLRARRRLLPGGNFPAYLTTIATNLWRDSQRWSRRAGPIANQRLVSLDEPIVTDDGDSILMADALPSPNSPNAAKRAMLKIDIDHALERLSPKLREVLIARFITGESCAEIAERYGRTEQTISGWVREAIREMKPYLEERTDAASPCGCASGSLAA